MTARGNDGGVTLIELMVGILLSAIVGAITTTAIVQSFHRQSEIDARAQAVQTVRQALERTMRELRQADPLLALGTDHLVFQEQSANGDLRKLTYSVVDAGSDHSLVLDEVDTPVGGSSVTLPTRTIARHLVNGSSVFSVVMPGNCALASDPTSYDPDCAELVQMHLVVDPMRASGTSTCAGAGPTCLIDVSDQADIRNNP
jgi:type II secretory pathway pseudopilin PulG